MACDSTSSSNPQSFPDSDRAEKWDLLERVKELDSLIQSGVSSVIVDGTSTKFDIKEARKERESLLLRLGYRKPRRLFTSIKSSGV